MIKTKVAFFHPIRPLWILFKLLWLTG